MAGIVCEQCKISNPVDRKTCVNCGAGLHVVKEVVSKPASPKRKPLLATPVPDDPARRDYMLYQKYGILPGRPAWIGGYALLLGLGAILLMSAAAVRIVRGSITETYGSFVPLIGMAAAGIVAMIAAVGLWKMQNRGRLLTLILQIIWIVTAAVVVYGTFSTFPSNMRREFFGRLTLTQTTITTVASVAAVILVPALFGLYLLGYWSFKWLFALGGLTVVISSLLLLVIGIALIVGGIWMIIAVPIILFEPTLFSLVDPDIPLPGLLRLGLVISIPINLLVAIGLVIERPRFT
jgi:hypothetical protein